MVNHSIYRHVLPLIMLTIVTLLLPLPTIYYGYLLEDYYYLRSYNLDEIVKTFHSHWEPSWIETKGYRPLHSIHYALFYRLLGGEAVKNHLLHLLLLLIGVYLLYVFMLRCTNSISASFWTALIYPCLGTTAWQVSWLVNRQHLLLFIFFMASLNFYNLFLSSGRKTAWFGSLISFLLALLLKEAAVTLPLIIFFFAVIVKSRKAFSQIKPLLPFFLILGAFLVGRSLITRTGPEFNVHPPPPHFSLGWLIYEYARSCLATFLQSHGVRDPANVDFPVYGTGISSLRDLTSLVSLVGFFCIGGFLLLVRGTTQLKRAFLFGLAFLLAATIMVAAWYRTNRLFISSIGVAIMAGVLLSGVFRQLARGAGGRKILIGSLALLFFSVYLAVNLITYLEIQWALRPDGYLALAWDGWLIDEGYLPWIKEEQLLIFKDKLIRSGRGRWAQALLAIREDEAKRLTRKPFEPVRQGKPEERIRPSRRFDNLWRATPVPRPEAGKRKKQSRHGI